MRKFYNHSIVFMLCIAGTTALSQPRQIQSINSGWQFSLNDKDYYSESQNILWHTVNLPHTWNALDIIDDTAGYHQGIGWYRKKLFIPEQYVDKHLQLYFEGACNKTTVFINGSLAKVHNGGFTGFRVSMDGKTKPGENEILVKVDNSKNLRDSIPPYSGDFSMMGGIYRDVWLEISGKIHFEEHYGSNGIFFQPIKVTSDKATFRLEALVKEAQESAFTVSYLLKHKDKPVAKGILKRNSRSGNYEASESIANPALWSPEEPNLYLLTLNITDKKGKILDEITQNVGFKWVEISRSNEFMLNGKPYKLKGAARHQDYKNLGNAMTNAMSVHDIELMKEMGCNFIRISHYPQDPSIYEACDRLGLIAWSEIPVVDRVVDNPTFLKNSEEMMREMIFQNMNHTCVAIWGYHNEVRDINELTITNARNLNSIAKETDPARLTAMAYETNMSSAFFKSPRLDEMLGIPDINGYNVYQGWYAGSFRDIGNFLDKLYALRPDRPVLLSEYGAGSITNLHTYQPTIFDFSEEYQCLFHEAYVMAGNSRPWMIGFSIWNFIDFQRDGREDVIPNINKKGMVTTDRKPKDVYYFYKSQWSSDPFIYITGKHWTNRIMFAKHDDSVSIPVRVYSNQKELSLIYNGKVLGSVNSNNGVFDWKAFVKPGFNQFICKTTNGKLTDLLNIQFQFIDSSSFNTSDNWSSLNFNTGQSRTYFTDPKSNEQWLPDKVYTEGTWGYVGGKIWDHWPNPSWNGVREGIHKPIALTDNEPLFQTFVQGPDHWKADVPDGLYQVKILLCEPFIDKDREPASREFNIFLNGRLWIEQLNLAQQFGVQTAVAFDKIIDVKEGRGIDIEFKAINGLPILNGVSIRKMSVPSTK